MKRWMVAVAAVAMSATGWAEESKISVKITDLKVEDTVYTPFYEARTEQNHEQGAAQKWIRLGVYFTTKGGWIDEIDVHQTALVNCGSENGLMMEEKVHYINIEPGDHVVYVYLHPSYVKRYDIDAFDVDAAARILINGEVVAGSETTKHCEKGWSGGPKVAKAKNYLLNHAETPFWFINYDFNEIIKREDTHAH